MKSLYFLLLAFFAMPSLAQAQADIPVQYFNFKAYLIFILLLVFKFDLNAQDIRFEKLTTEDGLSQNSIFAIAQDKYNFLWIGTADGLNRYDGNKFIKYYHQINDKNSLPDNVISALFKDREGNLWIGTPKGLSLFDYKSETFKNFYLDEQNEELGRVMSMFEDRKGRLWVGTVSKGLKCFDKKDKKFINCFSSQVPTVIKNSLIRQINQDKEGNLYIAILYKGLIIIDEGLNKFMEFRHQEENPNSLSSDDVTSVCITQNQVIWIGTYGGGLDKLDLKNNKFTNIRHKKDVKNSLTSDYINSILQTTTGEIWIATEKGGLNLLESADKGNADYYFTSFQNNSTNPKSLTINEIYYLHEDDSGILWVGTAYGGLNYFDIYKRNYFLHYRHDNNTPNSLSHNSIRRIFEDKDRNLWIASSQGGINLATPENRKNGKFETPSFAYVNNENNTLYRFAVDICQDKNGNIWAATFGGLFQYIKEHGVKKNVNQPYFESRLLFNPKDSSATHLPSKQVWSIFCDSKNNLWIGMIGGLCVWDSARQILTTLYPIKGKPIIKDLKIATVTCFGEDLEGNIWFGSQGGGVKLYNPLNQKLINYKHEENDMSSLANNRITAIHVDKKGTVWLGTYGGLSRFNSKTSDFSNFGKKDEFPNEVIYGILEDNDDNLWLSTNMGIIKFDKIKEKVTSTFNISDGLQSNEFNINAFHKSPRGEMFFGGVNGVNAFFPAKIVQRTYKPNVVITDFQIDNKRLSNYGTNQILRQSITETEEIVIPYGVSILNLEFAATDFSNAKRIQYKYRVLGFDKTWNSTDAMRPYATYTNLPPKTYIFEVKATNGDGVWNEKPKTLKIIILPPFWLTWWAYTFYAMVVLASVWSLRRAVIQRERLKASAELNALKSARLEEVDKLKSQFFSNISHEFRTPLTLILSPVEKRLTEKSSLPEGEGWGGAEAIKSEFRLIYRNAKRLLELINQLLDVAKLEAGTMEVSTSAKRIDLFLEKIAENFRHLSQEKSIYFSAAVASTNVYAQIDSDKVSKILNNLLSNAFKFTPEGGTVAFSASIEKIENQISPLHRGGDEGVGQKKLPKSYLHLKVSDTGIGIPQAHLDKVFDRFHQVESSLSRKYEGSGIGLSLTKELVNLLGGEILVESEEEKGSTFFVKLPLLIDKAAELSVSPQTTAIETGTVTLVPNKDSRLSLESENNKTPLSSGEGRQTTPNKKQPLCLVVEDNEDMRTYLESCLNVKFQILTAENGSIGYEVALKHLPDLIVTDVMMPLLNGFELCKLLKENELTNHIPIVMLTAKANPESRVEGVEYGADSYLVKPFYARELVAVSVNLVKQRRILRDKFAQEFSGSSVTLASNKVQVLGLYQKGLAPEMSMSADEKFIQKVKNVVEKYLSDVDFNNEMFAEELNLSVSQLTRKLKTTINQSPSSFARTYRLHRAAELLVNKTANVSEIAFQVGFDSLSYFTKCFKAQFGKVPSEF